MMSGTGEQVRQGSDDDGDVRSLSIFFKPAGYYSSPANNKPRKSRAIGLLARRMVAELPDFPDEGESWEMSVEQVVRKLDASRGSVYEVFHVLESILLVTKIGTNTYRWNGFGLLRHTLAFLKWVATMMDLPADIRRVKDHEIANLCQESQRKEASFLPAADPSSDPSLLPAWIVTPDNPYPTLLQPENGTRTTVNPLPPTADKIHILRVCQKFVMLFLVAPHPKSMTLEFASKVIHGTHLPDSVLKSRTRRLYDISNVLTSINGPNFTLMIKVNMQSLNSPRQTAIQYRGPEVDNIALTAIDIMMLPDYRRKHMYFDHGKALLGIPERPTKVPGLTTVRLKPIEDGVPIPAEPTYGGLHLDRMAAYDIRLPLNRTQMLHLLSVKVNARLPPQIGASKDADVANVNAGKAELWTAILPGQTTFLQNFESPPIVSVPFEDQTLKNGSVVKVRGDQQLYGGVLPQGVNSSGDGNQVVLEVIEEHQEISSNPGAQHLNTAPIMGPVAFDQPSSSNYVGEIGTMTVENFINAAMNSHPLGVEFSL